MIKPKKNIDQQQKLIKENTTTMFFYRPVNKSGGPQFSFESELQLPEDIYLF